MESQILASPGSAVPVNAGAWESASEAVLAAMQKAETGNGTQLSAISASLSNRLVTEAVLAGGLGLPAVVASVFLLVWFGRKVTGDLGRLHDSVRGMAEERLPRVVERLRRGDDVDVARRVPAARHQQHPGDLPDRGVVRHRAGGGRRRRRRPGAAAQGESTRSS